MATGAIAPGGIKVPNPGGLRAVATGGIDGNNWRINQGHTSVDTVGPTSVSGARALVTRKVANARKDAKTTSITYAWTLPTVPGGSTTAVASITTSTAQQSTFLPDAAGTYVFRCTVTYVKASGNTTQQVNYTYISA